MSSSSSDSDTRHFQSEKRPTLPPIRDLFRDELSQSARQRLPHGSPSTTLARLSVSDDEAPTPRLANARHAGVLIGPGSRSITNMPTTSMTHSIEQRRPSLTYGPSSRVTPPALPTDHLYLSHDSRSYSSRSRPNSSSGTENRFAQLHPLPHSHAPQRNPSYPSIRGLLDRGDRASSDVQRGIPPHYSDVRGTVAFNRADWDALEKPEQGTGPSAASKYECSYCGKGFNRPSSLKIHLNSHTGEKPFTCPFEGCGRSFSVLSNMRRHARVHSQNPHSSREDSSEEGSDEASMSSLPACATRTAATVTDSIAPDSSARQSTPSSASSQIRSKDVSLGDPRTRSTRRS